MAEVFGCTIFSPVHLREYAVVIGSLVATLTELYEPFGINDNVRDSQEQNFTTVPERCGIV